MNVSRLIELLQEYQRQHGDMPIRSIIGTPTRIVRQPTRCYVYFEHDDWVPADN